MAETAADLPIKCSFKMSTGALWLPGTSFWKHRLRNDPETMHQILTTVIIPSGGFVVRVVISNSVEVVVRITEMKALEDILTRYQRGQLRNDLERMFVTEGMRHVRDTFFAVEINEEDYFSAVLKLTKLRKGPSGAQEKPIPLVLPNNCNWDAQTGKYVKKAGVRRNTLNTVPKTLDRLRKIKGPVCVVSIAGPCRKGKSYILSKAFDHGEVFPLGHLLDPETIGIWLWVVPQKFKDSTGREFTVVLLDSEGVDSVYAKQTDDHRIFTLSVLLSSILIYNSAGVPNRSDLKELDFIVKLSQQIQLHNKKTNARDKDDSHFYETFPNFIWLLRDVVLFLPREIHSLKEYFLKKVLNAHNEDLSEDARNTAESILKFFSAFDAFSLPPPGVDPKVVTNLNDKENEKQINPQFLNDVQAFKKMLHSKLSPKKSINGREFVTGEALAALVHLFVEALNTPGTVPNVENAWNTFVHSKCIEVLYGSLAIYKQEMTSRVEKKIPCEADEIRAAHLKALDAGFEMFRQETLNLSIKSIDTFLNKLEEEADLVLSQWIQQNTLETEACCIQLMKDLKRRKVDPVLNRLHGPEGSKIQFSDIVNVYDQIQESYNAKARGAKDVQATVFMNFQPKLKREMKRNLAILQRMKDYDESLAKKKAEKAVIEEQRLKQKEEIARLGKKRQVTEREMVFLRKKQEEERTRIEQMCDERLNEHKQQTGNMMQANFKERLREREDVFARQKTMEDMLEVLNKTVEKKDQQIHLLTKEIERKEAKEGAIASLKTKVAQLERAAMDEERRREQTISDLQRTLATRQNELQMIRRRMDEHNRAGMEGQQQLYVYFQDCMQAKQAEIDQLRERVNVVNQDADDRVCEIGQEIDELNQGEECDGCVIL